MNEYTDVQIITQHGRPAFAVMPYSEFLNLTGQKPDDNDIYIPHEVVELHLAKGLSLIAAWRKYKSLTQMQMAKKLGVSQATYARIEKAKKSRKSTLEHIAQVLKINYRQLTLD